MKVIIAGSRHMARSLSKMIQEAVSASGFDVTEVVCGMARGADRLGHEWADFHQIPVKEFPADWNRYKKAAGPIRNRQMADYADAAIVFIWDGSRGSRNMIHLMQKIGKPCYVVRDGKINETKP